MDSKQNVKPKSSSNAVHCERLCYAAKEAFKRLRKNTEIELSVLGEGCKVIGITSAQPNEGKSTIALNLAYSLAEHEARVVLIDADMRRPSIHEKIGISRTPGLSALLSEEPNISAVIRKYESSAGNTAFDIIPSGEIISNPSEMLDSKRMQLLIEALSEKYDYIVLDLPPVEAVIDAVAVTKFLDGVIVVLRENKCSRTALVDCVYQLEHAGARILGFAVNGAMEGSGKEYKNGYYRKYNYSYNYR